jgi:ABC-type transport system involved in cytochrome c biogenesis permease subunit
MNDLARYVPWVAVGLTALFLGVMMVPASDPSGQMQVEEYGYISVLENGRCKPLERAARTNLLKITNRQTVRDAELNQLSAIRWMLDMQATGLAEYYRTFRIQDEGLVKFLGLKPNAQQRYHLDQLEDRVAELRKLLEEIEEGNKKGAKITPLQRAALVLAQDLQRSASRITRSDKMREGLVKQKIDPRTTLLFRIENDQVLNILGLKAREGFRYSYDEVTHSKGYRQFVNKSMRVADIPEDKRDVVDVKVAQLAQRLMTFNQTATLGGTRLVHDPDEKRHATLLVVPTQEAWQPFLKLFLVRGDKIDNSWVTLYDALELSAMTGQASPDARALETILYAYATGNTTEFNKELSAYLQTQKQELPGQTSKTSYEVFLDNFEPFYLCSILYVFVCLLGFIAWIGWRDVLNRTAFYLALLLVVVHSWALISRMYLQGRPPVTNLYSSAVFIGWGAVVLCLFIEWIFRNGIANIVAAVLGALTLLVAHHLEESSHGETMEMMVAVLDTNFWLATHVTCVTLGYTATFVAGFFGAALILMGVFMTGFTREGFKTLSSIVYGVVCFATLLSFVGTVLGGIWADQSWGRFWGWDPKENGAVLIVIWNALILHARWGGMIKERGMAVLAVVGNMVTGWSWFGTNQLSVGLHNYGFNKSLAIGLVVFWITQAIVIGIGLLPLRYWRSLNPEGFAGIPPSTPLPGQDRPQRPEREHRIRRGRGRGRLQPEG